MANGFFWWDLRLSYQIRLEPLKLKTESLLRRGLLTGGHAELKGPRCLPPWSLRALDINLSDALDALKLKPALTGRLPMTTPSPITRGAPLHREAGCRSRPRRVEAPPLYRRHRGRGTRQCYTGPHAARGGRRDAPGPTSRDRRHDSRRPDARHRRVGCRELSGSTRAQRYGANCTPPDSHEIGFNIKITFDLTSRSVPASTGAAASAIIPAGRTADGTDQAIAGYSLAKWRTPSKPWSRCVTSAEYATAGRTGINPIPPFLNHGTLARSLMYGGGRHSIVPDARSSALLGPGAARSARPDRMISGSHSSAVNATSSISYEDSKVEFSEVQEVGPLAKE